MTRRSFLLLEVVLGLALLASLGVGLLSVQVHSLRQYRLAREMGDVARRVEALLWAWNASNAVVTLPANGELDADHTWRREIRPVRLAEGVLPLQVSVIVTQRPATGAARDVYRVDWVVMEQPKRSPRP